METIEKLKAAAQKQKHGPISEKTKMKISRAHLGLKMSVAAVQARTKAIMAKPLIELACSICNDIFYSKFKGCKQRCPKCRHNAEKLTQKNYRLKNSEKIASSKHKCYIARADHYKAKAKTYRIRKHSCYNFFNYEQQYE